MLVAVEYFVEVGSESPLGMGLDFFPLFSYYEYHYDELSLHMTF